MKLKYFLRGLGAGILFGTAIMLVAYVTSGRFNMTDKEIMDRAKELGMVKVEETVVSSNMNDEDATTTEEMTTEATTEEVTTEATTEEVTTEVTTEEVTTEATTEATTEEVTTKATTEEATTEKTTTEKTTTEKATTEKTDNAGKKATITVKAGMGSETVAALLQEAGVVESASDFDAYLMKNGYANRIEIGTFSFDNSMTYQEIAEELVKKQ